MPAKGFRESKGRLCEAALSNPFSSGNCRVYWCALVGTRGFEPPSSCTPSKRANQSAPRPDSVGWWYHVSSGLSRCFPGESPARLEGLGRGHCGATMQKKHTGGERLKRGEWRFGLGACGQIGRIIGLFAARGFHFPMQMTSFDTDECRCERDVPCALGELPP